MLYCDLETDSEYRLTSHRISARRKKFLIPKIKLHLKCWITT